jgi:hypothetical protein
MTTNRQFDDSEGTFGAWQETDRHCHEPTCNAPVKYRVWESSDGAYEDLSFRCANGHRWWVDGIDS